MFSQPNNCAVPSSKQMSDSSGSSWLPAGENRLSRRSKAASMGLRAPLPSTSISASNMRYVAVGWANPSVSSRFRNSSRGEGDGHQVAYGRVFAQLRHRIVVIIIEVGVVLRFCRWRRPAWRRRHRRRVRPVPRTPFRRSRCFSSGLRTGRPPYRLQCQRYPSQPNRRNRLIRMRYRWFSE